MKRTSPLFLGILILAAFITKCGPPPPSEIDISGQVFIVTQGGTNFKLGLVEVKAIEEPKILNFIQLKKQSAIPEIENINTRRYAVAKQLKSIEAEYDKATRKYEASVGSGNWKLLDEVNRIDKERQSLNKELALIEAEARQYTDTSYWFTDSPVPVQTAKTDADGNFVLRLKPGKYALVANSRRKVIDKSEEYYWLIWLDVNKGLQNRVFLSNDNLFETFCSDCVMKAGDIPGQF
jgi:hypothetical protein